MNVLIKLFFLLIVNLTVSKDINETLYLYRNHMLNLSSIYDYKIKFNTVNYNKNSYPSFSEFFFLLQLN